MTSNQSSTVPLSHNPPRWLSWLFVGVSFLGFLDAGYLTANHYLGIPLVCSLLQGCERVTASPYSIMFGVPVALLGVLYYLTIFIFSVWYIDSGRAEALFTMAKLSIFGMAAALWFVSVQLFILHAICLYCMFSALTSTTLFLLGAYTLRRSWIRA